MKNYTEDFNEPEAHFVNLIEKEINNNNKNNSESSSKNVNKKKSKNNNSRYLNIA